VVFLTVGSRWARMRRRSDLGGGQAVKAVGVRGKAAAEVLRASGLRGPIRGAPVGVARRLGRSEVHRWRGTEMRRGTYRRWQRRWCLPIRAMAHGAGAQGALRKAAATWVDLRGAGDKRRG
jgi:hypothetical protein